MVACRSPLRESDCTLVHHLGKVTIVLPHGSSESTSETTCHANVLLHSITRSDPDPKQRLVLEPELRSRPILRDPDRLKPENINYGSSCNPLYRIGDSQKEQCDAAVFLISLSTESNQVIHQYTARPLALTAETAGRGYR